MDWSDVNTPNAAGELLDKMAPVAQAFAQNFQNEQELGASFAVMIEGRMAINIRAGYVDKGKKTPWAAETLSCIYSSGKAVLAMLIARAVSDGLIQYEEPVATYWPEFGQNGKSAITVAELMSHQAGLCGFSAPVEPAIWLDWERVIKTLGEAAPLWSPGSANGYHPQTVGFMAGEILRRQTGKSVGEWLRNLSAEHGFDVYCGMSAAELERAAYMPKPPKAPDLGPITELKQLAFLKPWSAPGRVDRVDWAGAEIPGSNMHANAAGLAGLVHPLANRGAWREGERFISQSALDQLFVERCNGDDLVLPFHLSWAAGLMRNINRHFGPNESAFGHAGFGGSCVVIDPQNRLTAAYVMNKMSPSLVGDPRALSLIDATYGSL